MPERSLPQSCSQAEWQARRIALAKEKAATRARDAWRPSAVDKPMVRVDKDYVSRGQTAK